MSKSQVVAAMAEKCQLKKKQVAEFFEALAALAAKECKGSAGKFVIPGIGRCVKRHRAARMGRNPQTGEAIKIKAKTVAKIFAVKAFKDAVLGAK